MQKIEGKKRKVEKKRDTHGVWVGEVPGVGQPAAEVVVRASPAGTTQRQGSLWKPSGTVTHLLTDLEVTTGL